MELSKKLSFVCEEVLEKCVNSDLLEQQRKNSVENSQVVKNSGSNNRDKEFIEFLKESGKQVKNIN